MLFPFTKRKGRGREMGQGRPEGGEEEGGEKRNEMRKKERPEKVRE